MDQLVAILGQLGADATIIYQFGIFIVIYGVLRVVCLEKLQFVIETRENKTVKLEKNANKKFQKSQELMNDYLSRVKAVRAEAEKEMKREKKKITDTQKENLKKIEDEIDIKVREEKKMFQSSLDSKKKVLLGFTKELSDRLLRKLAD